MSSELISNDVCEGSQDNRCRKWLRQVTENAIENALNLQAEWARLVHVDIQSCKQASARRSSSLIFPLLALSPQRQKDSTPASRSKTWALARESDDRRQVAAKIDALLVKWMSAFSAERKASVSVAVNILEEALYQESKSRDEYSNPLLLDLRLRRVLCHFEAGNGFFLLQGLSPLYPVRTCHGTLLVHSWRSDPFPDVTPPASVGPNILAPMGAADSKEGSDDDSLDWERASLPLKGTVRSLMTAEIRASRRRQANSALLGAAGSGHKRLMEQSLRKHGQYASKKIVKRVINLISRNKKKESKLLKRVPRKQIEQQIQENALPNAQPERPRAEATKRRSGKLLGEMLKFGKRKPDRHLQVVLPLVSIQEQVLEQSSLADCHSRSDVESINLRGESGSSCSSRSSCEQHSISEIFVLCPFPDDRPSQHGIGDISLVNSSVVPAKVEEKLSTTTDHEKDSKSASLQSLETVAVTRTNMVFLEEHKDCNVASTSSPAAILDKSRYEHGNSTTSSVSSLFELQDKGASNSSLGATEEYGPFTREAVDGQAGQRTKQAAESHALLGVAQQLALPADTESAVDGSTISSTTGEGRTSLPLGRFLSERDDDELLDMELISSECVSCGSWEEPTEELDPLCCVCMVGLKGAAIIPCGHTYCRKCSREVWRGRRTCPLCNGNVTNILDIY